MPRFPKGGDFSGQRAQMMGDPVHNQDGVNLRTLQAYLGGGVRDLVGDPSTVLPMTYAKGDRWTDTSTAYSTLRVCKATTITHTLADWVIVGQQGAYFLHYQTVPEAIWTVAHNQDCYPIPTVVDDDGWIIVVDIRFVDRNTVIVAFDKPATGMAILLCGRTLT